MPIDEANRFQRKSRLAATNPLGRPETTVDRQHMSSIEKQAAKGAMWTIGAGLGSRAMGVLSTFALTYFIAPDDYGAVIDAFVIVLTAMMLGAFGVGAFLVVRKDITSEERFHVSMLHLGGTFLFLLLLFFFHRPFLQWMGLSGSEKYIPWLCVAAALDRLAALPERLMSRRMEFRQIALSRAVAEIVYAVTALVFGALGFEGMSIAYANIVQYSLLAIIMFRFVNYRDLFTPCRPSWKIVKRIYAFGGPLAIDELTYIASSKWDRPLMTRFFGSATTARYHLAYNLADVPAAHIGEHIGDVLLPSFTRMEESQRSWALQRATGFLAIIVFPMAIGLSLIANPLIAILFKPEWAGIAPMLTVLAALSLVRPIGWTMASYLQALSQTRSIMVLGLLRLAVLLGGLVVLQRFGSPVLACSAAGLAYAVHTTGSVIMVSRLGHVSVKDILVQLWPPLLACVPMAMMVLLVRAVLTPSWGTNAGTLTAEIVAGALTYVLAMRIMSPVLFESVWKQIQELVLKRKPESDSDSELDDDAS